MSVKPGSHAVDPEAAAEPSGPLFKDLRADGEPDITEIESLCVNCEENGTTRLLLTKVPFFREIIIMAFECPHCGFRSNEIQSGGVIQPRGCKTSIRVSTRKDLNREVVKSDSATVSVPELNFEIPASTQRGVLNTVEGLLRKSIEGLAQAQPQRYMVDPETAAKVAEFIGRLESLLDCETPFTFIVDDPAGNSFVENPCAPEKDPTMTVEYYERTAEHNEALGMNVSEQPAPEVDHVGTDEVMVIPSNCNHCQSPVEMRMKNVDIPHFKEVIIMAMNCEACGAKTNEVKTGGAISDKAKRITLHITSADDLSRDMLKSDTASIAIPEIDFESEAGTLGGRFTTIEGLLQQVKDGLSGDNPFAMGDSAVQQHSGDSFGDKMRTFLERLDKVMAGEIDCHFILDDPCGNSYLQNLYAPDADPEMTIEEYERTFEQNEELGLNDMKTEGYEQDDDDVKESA
ncbi:zinc finger protein [Capsaspora owczarzaki ATCC 30864]|uniref:Zinc finger protein n=1 Tax=Capsaspora owczarzaki (strain ATCC 30864) TaxID=595528 RepID=A0A0D2UAA0_CAPO3|nr:zinc finger protein [Capsaspora owczarzaki ATCC 30864]KJE91981.1 zinc finger protein [Capsaspora owczarzaki ATCC 30864]|eukprot:XP_004363862.1 zinc finger protein [Capsaspora owczarzaki ATCC 30864]